MEHKAKIKMDHEAKPLIRQLSNGAIAVHAT